MIVVTSGERPQAHFRMAPLAFFSAFVFRITKVSLNQVSMGPCDPFFFQRMKPRLVFAQILGGMTSFGLMNKTARKFP